MTSGDILKLNGTEVEPTVIKKLENSKGVDRLMFWRGNACEVVQKDGTCVTLYIGGLRNDKGANT